MSLTIKNIIFSCLLVILLVSQFFVAKLIVPEKEWFDFIGQPNYEELMPDEFSSWQRVDDSYQRITVSPEIETRVSELYSETVSRIYKNTKTNKVIMVSLAYGKDQMFPNQVHRPDACYPAQGFKIIAKDTHSVSHHGSLIPVDRLVAKRQFRTENVMYWIRLGNDIVESTMNLHYNRIYLAAHGYKADGLLFRVSEISDETSTSYDTQSDFIRDFLDSLSNEDRKYFLGGFWE